MSEAETFPGGDDPSRPVRQVFADELEAHLAELVEAGVHKFVSTLPAYAGLVEDEGTGPLRRNLELHLRTVAAIARSSATDVSRTDSAFLVSFRRAQQGFPLEDVLRSSHLMNQLCWDWVTEHPAFEARRAEFLRECWPLWLKYVDVMNSESSRAYVVAARENAEQDVFARRRLVERLIGSRLSTYDAHRAVQALGFREGVDFRLVLLQYWDNPSEDTLAGDLYDLVDRLRPACRDASPVAASMSEAIVVLVQCADIDLHRLRDLLGRAVAELAAGDEVSAGISRPITDLVEVRRHHDEMRQVVRVARGEDGRTALAEDVSLFQHAVSALHETIDQVCPPDLRVLVRDHPKHLQLWHETLDAYARHHHSVRETAEALHVHPNTIYYRLGQISAASGRDLSSMRDFTDVWIALSYWQLIQDHGGTEATPA